MTELEPIEPETAYDLYLEQKGQEYSPKTVQAHKYRLSHFVRWCQYVSEINNINNLTGRDLYTYKSWRREDGGLNNVTMTSQVSTLRVFIRWCEQIEAVEPGLSERLSLPRISDGEDERDVKLEIDTAGQILTYLEQYKFASRDHAVFTILWNTSIRIGALHSLDVDDVDVENRRIHLEHRPQDNTQLKNQYNSERYIALSKYTTGVVRDYIDINRHSVDDDEGREPLITSRYGRPAKTTIRRTVYSITRPCVHSNECPHDRVIDDCEAINDQVASKCPSSVSPHAIRRGAITRFLSDDVPKEIVSSRSDVSGKILDKHYDRRTEAEKAEQRRHYFEDLE